MASGWARFSNRCDRCGLDFRVDWGFYLGSIYVNYGVTAVVLTAIWVPVAILRWVPLTWLMLPTAAFCLLFPLWFWRYSRSLWLGLNVFLDRQLRERPADRLGEQTTDAASADSSSGVAVRGDEDGSFQFICPFCHRPVFVASEQAGTWSQCEQCGEHVLITPSRHTN